MSDCSTYVRKYLCLIVCVIALYIHVCTLHLKQLNHHDIRTSLCVLQCVSGAADGNEHDGSGTLEVPPDIY